MNDSAEGERALDSEMRARLPNNWASSHDAFKEGILKTAEEYVETAAVSRRLDEEVYDDTHGAITGIPRAAQSLLAIPLLAIKRTAIACILKIPSEVAC